uniref:Uncharacterized protein LOC114330768 isoform X1 n=1 Tax=Diabrotica virgifera virgifera TaxID=50390 RepID=A0A6P7FJ55_DIAVI
MIQRGKLMVELAKQRLDSTNVKNLGLPIADNLEKGNLGLSVDSYNHIYHLDDSGLAAAVEVLPMPVEDGNSTLFALEEVDAQAMEITLTNKKEQLGSTNNECARPCREKKSKGREQVQKMLQQTDDSINDPLFSSDSDVYEPSSTSNYEETRFPRRIKVLKRKTLSKKKKILLVILLP